MKKKIFIACDTPNIKVIKKIISQTKTNKLEIGYKFGLEFFILIMVENLYRNLKMKKFFLISN